MFSIPKLLVLITIILVVWYGFKWVGRLDKVRREKLKSSSRQQGREGSRRRVGAEDMEKCATCDVYVAADASSCGRPDCPYR